MAEAAPRKAFKDYFDREAASALARQVKAAHRGFDARAFVRRASRGLSSLEFAARVRQFSDALAAGLPPPPRALAILTRSLPDALLGPKRIAVGQGVELSATLRSRARKDQSLMLDFVVHYVRKRGAASAKVFKWTRCEVPAGGCITLTKRVPMRPTTTRTLYPGRHRVELQLNGQRVGEASFQLLAAR